MSHLESDKEAPTGGENAPAEEPSEKSQVPEGPSMTPDEEEVLTKKLRDLGYIE